MDAADEMAEKAKKDGLLLKSSGTLMAEGSNCLVSAFSKRGEKGINQDCFTVWDEFGCQEKTIFCGIFDGHGDWGHYVSKSVRESLPKTILRNWKLSSDHRCSTTSNQTPFGVWKQSLLRSCAVVDDDLVNTQSFDTFHSGTTGLTLIKQDDLLVVANVGDSRAVLATVEDGVDTITSVPLTYEFKPNTPHEARRIKQCQGRVFCLDDEPGVHRLWLPYDDAPGLAMSRAFGDHCVKNYGLISVPDVSQRSITNRDRFVVLATDGVWDVISNEEAVAIILTAPKREKSAKLLVECAGRAWRRKRRNVALDDCSVICIYFN